MTETSVDIYRRELSVRHTRQNHKSVDMQRRRMPLDYELIYVRRRARGKSWGRERLAWGVHRYGVGPMSVAFRRQVLGLRDGGRYPDGGKSVPGTGEVRCWCYATGKLCHITRTQMISPTQWECCIAGRFCLLLFLKMTYEKVKGL